MSVLLSGGLWLACRVGTPPREVAAASLRALHALLLLQPSHTKPPPPWVLVLFRFLEGGSGHHSKAQCA